MGKAYLYQHFVATVWKSNFGSSCAIGSPVSAHEGKFDILNICLVKVKWTCHSPRCLCIFNGTLRIVNERVFYPVHLLNFICGCRYLEGIEKKNSLDKFRRFDLASCGWMKSSTFPLKWFKSSRICLYFNFRKVCRAVSLKRLSRCFSFFNFDPWKLFLNQLSILFDELFVFL